MVVVVSPTTLKVPPAFEAATIAARTHVHLRAEELVGHRSANERGHIF